MIEKQQMPPLMSTAWPKWPYFAEDEIAAVERVLRSGQVNYWTGDECHAFEREFADFIGTQYAISLANGTIGLESALRALTIGPGDEVIVPARTFIATASSVVAIGAKPIVADVELFSQTISADKIAPLINAKTKAIIVVHLAGRPADMDPILALARKHQLKVIEDCAQAHGAKYKNQKIGSLGDVGVFSFCQDKIMTTGGEGGMLVTNDETVWKNAWSYKDHGKDIDSVQQGTPSYVFQYRHKQFGTNWRMTEMQAAIGRIQLTKLTDWVLARRKNARAISEILNELPAVIIEQPDNQFYHAYYKYYFFIRAESFQKDWHRDRLLHTINQSGVSCFSGICPEIYREQAFVQARLSQKVLPNAHLLGETSFMLLVHPTLSVTHCQQIAEQVSACCQLALNV